MTQIKKHPRSPFSDAFSIGFFVCMAVYFASWTHPFYGEMAYWHRKGETECYNCANSGQAINCEAIMKRGKQVTTKVLWIVVIVINFASLIWFFLGTTANFHRGIDLVSIVILLSFWIPSVILLRLFIWLLQKGWSPNDIKTNFRHVFHGYRCL